MDNSKVKEHIIYIKGKPTLYVDLTECYEPKDFDYFCSWHIIGREVDFSDAGEGKSCYISERI